MVRNGEKSREMVINGGNGGKWAVMGVTLEIDAAGSEKCR
mgnify:CR=1 FL=1